MWNRSTRLVWRWLGLREASQQEEADARRVKEGDELTIDYIHGLPQEERSAYLMENYGFDEASEIDSVSL